MARLPPPPMEQKPPQLKYQAPSSPWQQENNFEGKAIKRKISWPPPSADAEEVKDREVEKWKKIWK